MIEEIEKMSDDETRVLERAAATDPAALIRLTSVRLRRREGLLLVWVAKRGGYRVDAGPGFSLRTRPTQPVGPPGTVEVVLRGWTPYSEASITVHPPAPTERRAWALACLDLEAFLFRKTEVPFGIDLEDPVVLDLPTGKVVTTSWPTAGVTASAQEEASRAQ